METKKTVEEDKEIHYKTMGEIIEGDVLLSSDGAETTVESAYDVHIPERMFRLVFSNDQIIEASGNHLWYCVSSLDRQIHRERIKKAKKYVLPHINEEKMEWLIHHASLNSESSLKVDLTFIIESLGIDNFETNMVMPENEEYLHQVVRITESIGPFAIRNEYIYDEKVHSIETAGTSAKSIYKLNLFAQQMLALINEASKRGEKRYPEYELLIGKVRTTENIANTWELGYDFPATGNKQGFLQRLTISRKKK